MIVNLTMQRVYWFFSRKVCTQCCYMMLRFGEGGGGWSYAICKWKLTYTPYWLQVTKLHATERCHLASNHSPHHKYRTPAVVSDKMWRLSRRGPYGRLGISGSAADGNTCHIQAACSFTKHENVRLITVHTFNLLSTATTMCTTLTFSNSNCSPSVFMVSYDSQSKQLLLP
jgi:hypothetical protein